MIYKFIRLIQVYRDFVVYTLHAMAKRSLIPRIRDNQLCLDDKTENTGFDRHYIYFPAWAARILRKNKPSKHIDISSSLTFCTMISAFIPTDFYDYRPAQLSLSGLKSKHADITRLPFKDNTISSLSCMHVLEHIGLGRYGDPIDPVGDIKGAQEMIRTLAIGGYLLIVLPVGKDKIKFNAHRIYSYKSVMKLFKPLKLVETYLILDDHKKDPIYNARPQLFNQQKYACGCFLFKK